MEDQPKSMTKNEENKRRFIIIGVVLIVIIGLFIFWRTRSSSETGTEKTESVLPKTENLKKVEGSVKVSVVRVGDGKKVKFTVMNIPDKYKKIEYQFVYQTGSGGLQGGGGSPAKIKNNQYEKEILLGTCSAGGACTYDEGVKAIKFTVLFSSDSEKRFFEKKFNI